MTAVAFHAACAIRTAGQDDIAELKRMRLALQDHFVRANPHLLALSVHRVATLATFYRDLLADPQARVLIAQAHHSGRRIGMAVGRIVRHEEFASPVWGQVDDVWVEADYRHRGVCRALLARLVEFFEHGDVEVLVLDYVKDNREAESVWQRLGFQEVLTVANAPLLKVKTKLAQRLS